MFKIRKIWYFTDCQSTRLVFPVSIGLNRLYKCKHARYDHTLKCFNTYWAKSKTNFKTVS